MSSVIQTKTDQAIRALNPEQLAEYAVIDMSTSLKEQFFGTITETERNDMGTTFTRKYVEPLDRHNYQRYKAAFDRLDTMETVRSSYSHSFTYMSEFLSFTQALLTIIDRLMDAGYETQEGRPPDPEELKWWLEHAESVVPIAMTMVEKRKKDINELLEAFPEVVTLPPGSEFIPTPEEVREYMAKKQAGEEYHSGVTDPYDMPRIRLAKSLGVETEGRAYGEISKQIRDALYNVKHWDDPDEEPTPT